MMPVQNIKLMAFVFLIVLIQINQTAIFARETTRPGTAAAQFLKIGVGARAQALGGASAGLRDDVSSLYWNPAGIASIKSTIWQGVHTSWFADIKHDFGGVVFPVGKNTVVGLSSILLSMGDEEITTVDQPKGTGQFWNASDLAVGLSYAIQLTDRYSIGITGKYISERIYNEKATTFALDIGTSLKTPFKGMIIGMAFTNFGGDLQLEGRDLLRGYDTNPQSDRNDPVDTRLQTEPWPLPVNFRVGISLMLLGQSQAALVYSKKHSLQLLLDGNHPNDDAENLRLGAEFGINRILFLRAGYEISEIKQRFSFGAGLNAPLKQFHFALDYGLSAYADLGYVNFTSFTLQF